MTEKYLWLGRTRLLAIFDKHDALLQRFLYADGRMPMAMEQAGETYYFAYDQVGSLRAVTDASGNVVKNVLYDSFGRVISDSNPELKVPFGFAGGLQDSETGLVRFGYRDYDPETGRWTSKDPIGFKGNSVVLYDYVGSNPVEFIDESGRARKQGHSLIPGGNSLQECTTSCHDKFTEACAAASKRANEAHDYLDKLMSDVPRNKPYRYIDEFEHVISKKIVDLSYDAEMSIHQAYYGSCIVYCLYVYH
ncbi:RHS repeat domain-containing protein [Megalodesulfovibrio paquesii]